MSLVIENLCYKDYKNTKINVNGKVDSGDVLGLFGSSGCGKTTFLNVLAGFYKIESGKIMLNNQLISNLPAFRRKIAYVFQSNALFDHLNVCENVAFALRFVNEGRWFWRGSYRKRRAFAYLKEFSLEGLASKYPLQLSGGEQKRVAILRALIVNPRLLLLDEAFTGLDEENKLKTMSWMATLIDRLNIPVILVSHSREERSAFATKVVEWKGAQIQL